MVAGNASAQAPRRATQPVPKPKAGTPVEYKTPSTPMDARGRAVLAQASRAQRMKILVSTEDRWLWLIVGRDTLMGVPVAVGMGKSFDFDGQSFRFETPRGRRTVLSKSENPQWQVPEWHYLERAAQMGYKLVRMDREKKYLLEDGTFLLTIGDNVGRLNLAGKFWAFTPGLEVMFDSTVFMPPPGTRQRLVPDALGPFKLDTGDGYLIHGTHLYNEDSIGDAVSHGCVRMRNEDLDRLYSMVPVGTAVFIF
jgi:hypothetical protein